MFLIPYPIIDPVLLSLGPLQIRWYGLSYLFGALLGYKYGISVLLKRPPNLFKDDKQPLDLAIGALFSMIIGGRIGHVVLYEWNHYVQNPIEIFYVWKGGMAFHGALIGSCVYGMYQYKKLKMPFLYLADLFATAVPIGLFLGRVANFINHELIGRPTNMPWGMIFPGETLPRHPSQLYEAFFEGIVLFIVLNLCHKREEMRLRPGVIFGIFIAGYGFFRSICEYFREPDFVVEMFGFLTISSGQIYSIPMMIAGCIIGGVMWRQPKTLSCNS